MAGKFIYPGLSSEKKNPYTFILIFPEILYSFWYKVLGVGVKNDGVQIYLKHQCRLSWWEWNRILQRPLRDEWCVIKTTKEIVLIFLDTGGRKVRRTKGIQILAKCDQNYGIWKCPKVILFFFAQCLNVTKYEIWSIVSFEFCYQQVFQTSG